VVSYDPILESLIVGAVGNFKISRHCLYDPWKLLNS
jgi:hypothetical protein